MTSDAARPAPPEVPPGLVGRRALVLEAFGDFGHAVVDDEVWLIRHPRDVLHAGRWVRVVEQCQDHLLVLPDPDDPR